MKIKLLVALMLGAGFATAAVAQSSVTLYGRIDDGIGYQSGVPGGHTISAESGYWGESWWGMRGTEDLGGGTKAIFHLESGINTFNGAVNNGSLFGRAATVGLTNANFGTLNMGNLGAGELIQDSWDLDPQLMQQYSIATLVRGRNWSQTGNGFQYTSPSLSGLTVKGEYALGNSTTWNDGGAGPNQLGNNNQGRSDGLKIQYNNANFELQAMYDEIRDGNGQFDDVYQNSRSAMIGGTFTFGLVKLYGGYQNLSAPQATLASTLSVSGGTAGAGTPANAPTHINHEWLGASYQATPATLLSAAAYHANANEGNGSATMLTLAGSYNLSARTFFYTELAYLKNSRTSNVGLNDGYSDPYGSNTNVAGNLTGTDQPKYGQSQFGAFVGLMHEF